MSCTLCTEVGTAQRSIVVEEKSDYIPNNTVNYTLEHMEAQFHCNLEYNKLLRKMETI